MLIFTFKDFDN